MHCEDFESRLNQLLDERQPLANDLELAAHAGACPACGEVLAAYRGMIDAVAAMVLPCPQRDLVAGVLADWRPATQRRSRRVGAVAALALAAGLLIAVVPLFQNGRGPGGAPERAGSNFAVAVTAPDASPPPLIDQARATYEPLVTATGETLSAALAVLPRKDLQPDASENPSDASADEQTVSSEFAPLAQSASRSLVALLRVFPGAEDPVDSQGLQQ